jgi:phosphoribosylanthranilate isomerase
MTIKVKICGLSDKNEVQAVLDYGADYVGLVFYHKSPRNVTPKQAGQIQKLIKGRLKTVAVVVDMTDIEIEGMLKEFRPDYIQCHGSESVDRLEQIKKKYELNIIKAIPVRSSDDIAKAMDYTKVADMILFDAKAPSSALPGGNGLSFDWALLKGRKFDIPWMLSGGLNVENIKYALKTTDAKMVDVSSSIEIEHGVKDIALIKKFIQNSKSV